MELVRSLLSIISLFLLAAAGGLAYGLYLSRRLFSARAYAFSLWSFATLVWEQFLLSSGLYHSASGWRAVSFFFLFFGGPLQVFWGGAFLSRVGLPSGAKRLRWVYVGAALLLVLLGAAGLIWPEAIWGLLYRSVLVTVFISWISLVFLGFFFRPQPKKVPILIFVTAPLVASYVVADTFGSFLPWFLDGLSLGVLSLSLSLAGIFYARPLFNREPFIIAGKVTSALQARFGLTEREFEIVQKVLGGLSSAKIGEELFISTRTVENHLANTFQKCGVKSRFQLIHLILAGEGDIPSGQSASNLLS